MKVYRCSRCGEVVLEVWDNQIVDPLRCILVIGPGKDPGVVIEDGESITGIIIQYGHEKVARYHTPGQELRGERVEIYRPHFCY